MIATAKLGIPLRFRNYSGYYEKLNLASTKSSKKNAPFVFHCIVLLTLLELPETHHATPSELSSHCFTAGAHISLSIIVSWKLRQRSEFPIVRLQLNDTVGMDPEYGYVVNFRT